MRYYYMNYYEKNFIEYNYYTSFNFFKSFSKRLSLIYPNIKILFLFNFILKNNKLFT